MKLVTNFSARIFKSVAMIAVVAFTLVSCKKDNDSVVLPPTGSTSTIEGLFSGKYGFDNDVPDENVKYKVKEGGIFQEISVNNGSVVGQGTWVMNGTTLSANVTSKFSPYSKNSISANYNKTNGKLTGTWGWENSTTDGGKLDLTKQ